MKKIKVAINGFGRIGRNFLRQASDDSKIEIVAINSRSSAENSAYLLEFDSVYKNFNKKIKVEKKGKRSFICVDKTKIEYFSISEPEKLPWKDLKIDVVVEATGVFTSFEKSKGHIKAGAKKVIISGPVKEEQNYKIEKKDIGNTVLYGINDNDAKKSKIISNASCTTNAISLPLYLLNKKIGVDEALINTIHAYTSSQKIIDSSTKKEDFRKNRAGAFNIIPTSTGSALATIKVLKEFKGKFDGISVRVPVICGSLVDITFIASKKITKEEVNKIFQKASCDKKYSTILSTTSKQIVSSDIIGDTHACIVDLEMTRTTGKLVKILVWYDNESGYSKMLLENLKKMF